MSKGAAWLGRCEAQRVTEVHNEAAVEQLAATLRAGTDDVAKAWRAAFVRAFMTEATRLDKVRSERPEQARDKSTGQFVHDGKSERLCTCGHGLGVHSAAVVDGERPCFHGDLGGEPCACARFKLTRKKSAP